MRVQEFNIILLFIQQMIFIGINFIAKTKYQNYIDEILMLNCIMKRLIYISLKQQLSFTHKNTSLWSIDEKRDYKKYFNSYADKGRDEEMCNTREPL